MLAHLPAARREEALYSVLARFGCYQGVVEAGPFMEALLGRRHGIASLDLPGGLSALVGAACNGADCAIDDLIDRTTLFGFHTAFVPEELRAGVRAAMRGDVTGVYTRLGLATFRVRPAQRLRFCPACLAEMEDGGLDAWWRRDHQLPGVCVCPEHGIPLRLSDVDPARNRHAFVPASRDVCRKDAELAVAASPADLAQLHELARLAADLLVAPPAGAAFADINAAYRDRLAEVGLMRSERKVDHSALREAFVERWGENTNLIEGLSLGDKVEGSWLATMVRSGRRAAHPLQHLMLRGLLDSLAAAPRDRPFGAGPWPCRNPAADHHGVEVIERVTVRRDGDVRYGDFACSCGYLYTRSLSTSGGMGEPRYRAFGPLLAPALRAAVAAGKSLRGTAAELGLDPKTLMREAAMAGVEVPWSTKPSGVVLTARAVATAVPAETNPHPAKRPRRPRRNWFAIDVRLSRSVGQVAADLLRATPPVRVTAAAIEARIARRDWIVKRTGKLPRTVAAIEAVVEGTDAFRSRRMEWHVRQALWIGDVRPCSILRAAGLPCDWLDAVRNELARATLRNRSAA